MFTEIYEGEDHYVADKVFAQKKSDDVAEVEAPHEEVAEEKSAPKRNTVEYGIIEA